MSTEISLGNFVKKFIDSWFHETIVRGRVLPNHKDGLKESTRAILTAVARESNYDLNYNKFETISALISSEYREGTSRTIDSNIFRFANIDYPLIMMKEETNNEIISPLKLISQSINPHYLMLTLTPLGKYVMKYRKYFDTRTSDISNTEIYDHIKTPLPLSLIIPQRNLTDGISNDAPALNINEVIDAMILHIEKDKKTTTEELAGIIKGIEIGKGAIATTTPQGTHDLIEKGVAKYNCIYPIKLYKDQLLYLGLPYRTTLRTIRRQLDTLAAKHPNEGGFKSFRIELYRSEQTDEAYTSFLYKLNPGYTVDDMREEFYEKTRMREVIVYENFCIDTDLEKPIVLRSVRQTLDYHYKVGLELKLLEVEDELKQLESERAEAEFLEKVSRLIIAEGIVATITNPQKERLTQIYFENIYNWALTECQNIYNSKEQEQDIPEIFASVVKRNCKILLKEYREEFQDKDVTLEQFIQDQVPNNFTYADVRKVHNPDYQLLYKLDRRDKALETLRLFYGRVQKLKEQMKHENLKKELISELRQLKDNLGYKGRGTTILYATDKVNRLEARREASKARQHLSLMERKLPFSIHGYKDGNMRRVISNKITEIPEFSFDCVNGDYITFINKGGQSYNLLADYVKFTEDKCFRPDLLLAAFPKPSDRELVCMVTNRGRILLLHPYVFNFRSKTLENRFPEEEIIVKTIFIPIRKYNSNYSLLIKTETNKVKKVRLDTLSVKMSLVEPFNIFLHFNEKITDAILTNTDSDSADAIIWGEIGTFTYDNQKSFKRNVSQPLTTSYKDKQIIFTQGRLAVNEDGFILPSTKFEYKEPMVLEPMSDYKVYKTFPAALTENRRKFDLKFKPDKEQIDYYLQFYNKRVGD